MLISIHQDDLVRAVAARYPLYPHSWAVHTAARIIEETDARLEPNVAQFIAGQPLGDIWVRSSEGLLFSVSSIMERRRNDDFVGALDALNLLLIGNEPLAMQLISGVRL